MPVWVIVACYIAIGLRHAVRRLAHRQDHGPADHQAQAGRRLLRRDRRRDRRCSSPPALGIPVSTTHTITGAIVGGAEDHRHHLDAADRRRLPRRRTTRCRCGSWSACYVTIGLGTLFGGWRIVKTMGQRITKLKPVGGFCAETGGAVDAVPRHRAGHPGLDHAHHHRRDRRRRRGAERLGGALGRRGRPALGLDPDHPLLGLHRRARLGGRHGRFSSAVWLARAQLLHLELDLQLARALEAQRQRRSARPSSSGRARSTSIRCAPPGRSAKRSRAGMSKRLHLAHLHHLAVALA